MRRATCCTSRARPGRPAARAWNASGWSAAGSPSSGRPRRAEVADASRAGCCPGWSTRTATSGSTRTAPSTTPPSDAQATTDRDAGALLLRDAGSPADTRWIDDRAGPAADHPGRPAHRPHPALPAQLRARRSSRTSWPPRCAGRPGAATAGSSWSATGSTASIGRPGPVLAGRRRSTRRSPPRTSEGARVTAHCFGEDCLPDLLAAGIDCIEHATGLTEDTRGGRRGARRRDRADAGQHRTFPADRRRAAEAKFPRYAAHMRALHARRYATVREAVRGRGAGPLGTDAGGSLPHGLVADEVARAGRAPGCRRRPHWTPPAGRPGTGSAGRGWRRAPGGPGGVRRRPARRRRGAGAPPARRAARPCRPLSPTRSSPPWCSCCTRSNRGWRSRRTWSAAPCRSGTATTRGRSCWPRPARSAVPARRRSAPPASCPTAHQVHVVAAGGEDLATDARWAPAPPPGWPEPVRQVARLALQEDGAPDAVDPAPTGLEPPRLAAGGDRMAGPGPGRARSPAHRAGGGGAALGNLRGAAGQHPSGTGVRQGRAADLSPGGRGHAPDRGQGPRRGASAGGRAGWLAGHRCGRS